MITGLMNLFNMFQYISINHFWLVIEQNMRLTKCFLYWLFGKLHAVIVL